jgi:hypothetical protein
MKSTSNWKITFFEWLNSKLGRCRILNKAGGVGFVFYCAAPKKRLATCKSETEETAEE